MAGKLLSLHTAPTSKFTTITSSSSRCASNSLFLSPVSVTIPSIRPLQLERRNRILVPVPRAGGPPSTGSLLFAFFLPLSLLVGTILATLRVGKQLDQKFLEEIEMNIALMEENEMEYDEISEEIEDENEEEEMENDEFVSVTPAQSRAKQEL